MARQRLTRRDWIIRIVALVVLASFLAGAMLAIVHG
jgi:hypothetical protein